MHITVKPGKYIVAVSGGVDSVVLLNLLVKQQDLELVVAHFNHGMRELSVRDESFVKELSNKLNLNLELGYGNLGDQASEETARKARYDFLSQVQQRHEAKAIITAHHQDDLIETALINILRGTGPRGLIAIHRNENVVRPLLNIPKTEIIEYANKNGLKWVEDETNTDTKYLRNYLRHKLLAKLNNDDRQLILSSIDNVNSAITRSDDVIGELSDYIFKDKLTIKRSSFIFLPSEVANEVVARWLRENNISSDSKAIYRLVNSIKTARGNSVHDINRQYLLKLAADEATLERKETATLL